ncbi:MAG TPA: carbohydrate ABC transporter permease [Candidatus Paceibacterota bacterium]|nr:MAG: ABC transporter permease [Spirochaetes bacterium RBG_13_68_11]HXK36921.1 carbohydrate ABC transporter permease [Candidatus Paceibacterota bacterium]
MRIRFAPRKIPLYLVLIVLTIVWLLPVASSSLTSFKSSKDFVSQTWSGLPTEFYFFKNLATVLREYRIQDNLASSFIYAASGAAVAIVAASMAGFSIVRLRPKFNFLLFLIIYSGTLFPFQMYLIPVYRLFNTLGLYDTRTGMILIYSAICIPFSVFVYRGFYTTVPREIEEAAKLDGCGPVRSFVSVFLPQSLPPTAVVALFQATWIWNDLLFGMVLSRTQYVRPVMVAVATMTGYGGGNIPWIMTAVIFTSIPTILLFVWLRRYFIQGMVLSVQA